MGKGKKKVYEKPSYEVAEIFEKLSLKCPQARRSKGAPPPAGNCHRNQIIS